MLCWTDPLLGAGLFPPGPESQEPLPSKQTLLLQILLLAVSPVLGNSHPGRPGELPGDRGHRPGLTSSKRDEES